VAKPPWLLEEYLVLADELAGGNVIELGIAKGGSVAFFAHILRPHRFLALELRPHPNAALEGFIADHGFGDSIRTAYGVDQADVAQLRAMLDEHFEGQELDLVIDDASHLLGPTVASFDVLFPRLRAGGVYVLEDWSHGHTWERVARVLAAEADADPPDSFLPRDVDLSRLILDLVMTSGYSPETVAEIQIRNGFAFARKGDAVLDPLTFELRHAYGEFGASHFST
jgi:predicted O-methyltransferase YrrM